MNYYQKKYVAYEIIKNCKNRDFSALGKQNANIRGLKVNSLFTFDRALKLINWETHKQNLYRSVATLRDIPFFTFNPRERSKQTKDWYKDEYSDFVEKYDLFMDFDKEKSDSWEKLIEEVRVFKEYLDDYKVSYQLIFSGQKGFQIIISGEYLDIEKIENGNVYPHKTIVEDFKEAIGLKYLDLANNGVNSRLCKIPYSLIAVGVSETTNLKDFPESAMNVALPLSDEDLDIFNIEKMNLIRVMNSLKIIRRGNLERNENLTLEQKRRNLDNFIKLFNF